MLFRKMFRPATAVFLFLLLSWPLASQEFYFRSMAPALNLPSDECYNILRDSKGYIWIATEYGLCRYNGNDLTVYDHHNGLPEQAVYFMKEDKQGVIWLITSASRILQVRGDSLQEAPESKAYLDYRRSLGDNTVTYNLEQTAEGLLVNNESFSSMGKRGHPFEPVFTDSLSNYEVLVRKEGSYAVKNPKTLPVRFDKGRRCLLVNLVSATARHRIEIGFKKDDNFTAKIRLAEYQDVLFLAIGSSLVRINKNSLTYSIHTQPSRINCLMADGEGGLWIGLVRAGLRYFPDINTMDIFKEALNGSSVSGVCIDHEGSIWCTTLEKNVFYCGSRDILHFPGVPELSGRSMFLKTVGDTIFSLVALDELLLLHNNKLSKKDLNRNKTGDVTDIMHFNKNWYVSTKSHMIRYEENFTNPHMIMYEKIRFVSSLQTDYIAGKIFILTPIQLLTLDGDHISKVLTFPFRGRNMVHSGRNKLYIGGNDGIYSGDIETGLIRQIKPTAIVTRLIRTRNGNVLFSTRGEGLWRLRNDSAKRLGEDLPEIISDIEEDKYGRLWLASNTGIIRMEPGKNNGYRCTRYDVACGLPSDNINALTVTKDHVYFNTASGLFLMPLNADLSNKVPPLFYIRSLRMNGKVFSADTSNLVFPFNQNSLFCEFDILSFKKNAKGNLLVYQLAGRDSSFIVSDGYRLGFENLPPGNYRLTAYALNNSGLKSKAITLAFTINPPFWRTWLFFSACIVALLLLFLAAIRLVIKRIRKKEAEKTRIDKLIAGSQLSALQAQMNPHFIFNAINSIQNYILKKEEELAYTYLAKFSRLIRLVLNHSRQHVVSLGRELELLKLYVEIEQLRFRDKFKFTLNIHPDVDVETLEIPTMLIQPYLENAIWHGLMNKEDCQDCELRLSIDIQDSFLSIMIEDNGVGRVRAKEYKRATGFDSVAMKLTSERLEIINKLRGQNGLKEKITDLYDASGKACGTRVELFLTLDNELA